MSETTRMLLRRSLVDGYSRFKRRLTLRLGSASLASEALNETWLRLGQGSDLDMIANADAYVYRAALNMATNLRKRDDRHARHIELSDAGDIEDEAPRPDRAVADQDEVQRLMQALNELPQRQRDAFLDCFRGDAMPEDFARRHGVSVRTIQADIRAAILHCAERLGRKDILAGKRVRLSRD